MSIESPRASSVAKDSTDVPDRSAQCRTIATAAKRATNLAGLICAALVLVTLALLTGLFEQLPNAVLAGIVIVAGVGLFALDDFKALWRLRRSEFWLGTVTVASVLVLGRMTNEALAKNISSSTR